MSTDNWAICPQCKIKKESAAEKKEAKVRNLYGKISAQEYENALSNLTSVCEKEPPATLREDYEIFMRPSMELYISYSCSCQACGFSFEFQKDIPAKKLPTFK